MGGNQMQQMHGSSQRHVRSVPIVDGGASAADWKTKGREEQAMQSMVPPARTGQLMTVARGSGDEQTFGREKPHPPAAAYASEYNNYGGAKQPPYKYDAILRDADSPPNFSSTEKILDQLYQGVFLKQKREKYWVDWRSNANCFMLYAKGLSIIWSDDTNYWNWFQLKEAPNDTPVDAVELLDVCWLDVTGKFNTRYLTPETLYEVAFVVKLQDPAYGWDKPVKLNMVLPNGQNRPQAPVDMRMQKRYKWFEIPVGKFVASSENAGEITVSMNEREGGEWKKGLLIKGVVIRPSIPAYGYRND